MTKEFENYVTVLLSNEGIPENVEFETSDEDYGKLKWVDGTMYELGGEDASALSAEDIAHILEETDIKKIPVLKKITFVEALERLRKGHKNIYVGMENDNILRVETRLLKFGRGEGEYFVVFYTMTMRNMLITRLIDHQFYVKE